MDFWTIFNWLWGGIDAHEILWPDAIQWAFVIGVGFIEFITFLSIKHLMNKFHGWLHSFCYFVVLPVIYNIQADSLEGIRLLTVQDRYTRYVSRYQKGLRE